MPTSNDTTIYRDIDGYSGYRVGSDGSVWSSRRAGQWRRLKPHSTKGYLAVELYSSSTSSKMHRVHRLVASAFIGACPVGMECCHNNGISHDNRVANLRYDTPVGNCADKLAHGTDSRGAKHGMSKLTDSQVAAIREEYATGVFTQAMLAIKYGVSRINISYIVNNKRWHYLSSPSPAAAVATGE